MTGRLRRIVDHLLNEHASPGRLGLAVGIGLFVGMLPLFGLHLALCVGLAYLLRLNKVTVYLAANISNPLLAPFIMAAGLYVGNRMRTGMWRGFDLDAGSNLADQTLILFGRIPDGFLSCLAGDAVLGVPVGIMGGLVTWRWAAWRKRLKKVRKSSD